jgi:hypothetical protein
MLREPDERRLSEAHRRSLARFRATGAAAELRDDPHAWALEATSWLDEFPVRLIWRNEEGGALCFTLESDGMWRLASWASERIDSRPDDPMTALGRVW